MLSVVKSMFFMVVMVLCFSSVKILMKSADLSKLMIIFIGANFVSYFMLLAKCSAKIEGLYDQSRNGKSTQNSAISEMNFKHFFTSFLTTKHRNAADGQLMLYNTITNLNKHAGWNFSQLLIRVQGQNWQFLVLFIIRETLFTL